MVAVRDNLKAGHGTLPELFGSREHLRCQRVETHLRPNECGGVKNAGARRPPASAYQSMTSVPSRMRGKTTGRGSARSMSSRSSRRRGPASPTSSVNRFPGPKNRSTPEEAWFIGHGSMRCGTARPTASASSARYVARSRDRRIRRRCPYSASGNDRQAVIGKRAPQAHVPCGRLNADGRPRSRCVAGLEQGLGAGKSEAWSYQ